MTTIEYRDLRIAFATDFALLWNDKASNGTHDGAYWRPVLVGDLQGFHALGDYGVNHYQDVNGQAAVAVVSDTGGPSGTALREPLDYERVWTCRGTGSTLWGSMWRPVPPPGYVALGLLCNSSYDKPARHVMRCVRSDLVIAAQIGELIWDDSNTGASEPFSSWEIVPPTARPGEVYLAPGTFVGATSRTKPSIDSNAHALRVQIPLRRFLPPPTPQLRGYAKPTQFEPNRLAYISQLPWFMVNDPKLRPAVQRLQSPIYRLERTDKYTLIGFGHNQTSAPQSFDWTVHNGTHGSSSKTFTSTTGVEIGVEWGGGTFFKISAKLSQSFSHTETSTQGWIESTTRTVRVVVPPNTAVAAFVVESTYRLLRYDRSQVSGDVSYSDGDSFFWTQYPPSPVDTVTLAQGE